MNYEQLDYVVLFHYEQFPLKKCLPLELFFFINSEKSYLLKYKLSVSFTIRRDTRQDFFEFYSRFYHSFK